MRLKIEILEGDILELSFMTGGSVYSLTLDTDEALEVHGILGRAIFQARFSGREYPEDVGIDLDSGEYDTEIRPNDTTNVVSFKK